MTEQPHFDLWQFHKPSRAVRPDTGISFADYQTMHIHRCSPKPRAHVPPFASNNEQLKLTILQRAYDYVVFGGLKNRRIPQCLIDDPAILVEMVRVRTKKDAAPRGGKNISERDAHYRHNFVSDAAGSWIHAQASVAYLSWRLGWSSSEIANEMHSRGIVLTPWQIRVILYRLREVARRLGFDAGEKEEYRKTVWKNRKDRQHTLRVVGRKYERTTTGVRMTCRLRPRRQKEKAR